MEMFLACYLFTHFCLFYRQEEQTAPFDWWVIALPRFYRTSQRFPSITTFSVMLLRILIDTPNIAKIKHSSNRKESSFYTYTVMNIFKTQIHLSFWKKRVNYFVCVRKTHFNLTLAQSKKKVAIYTLPHLKCIRLVSVRSSHLPLKMH